MAETTAQEVKVLQVPSTVKRLLEALIFAAKEPLSARQIKAIYEQQSGEGELRTIDTEEIRAIIAELNDECQRDDKPYRIVPIAGGFQFATLSQYAEWLGKLYKEQARRKLSASSTETLAIIAYKQPISRPEIESIRGVNCDYVLTALLEKDLVTIVGRAPTPGRPLLYGTTKEFLKHFGLNEVTDLPRPREIEEILGESQFETERRMLEAQAGAAALKKEEEDFKSRLPHIPKRKPDLAGDVKIIQRSQQKEIKTVQSGQHAPEASGHGKIEFPPEDVMVTGEHVEELIRPDSQKSGTDATTESASAGVRMPTSPETQAAASEQVEATKEVQQAKTAFPERAAATHDDPPVPERALLGGKEITQEPEDTKGRGQEGSEGVAENVPTVLRQEEVRQPELTLPERKSAWHNWKEKIQTFIRTLFG
ncbi:MAG: SMC-Scp complex subunit ScpB [Ignavibacteriales bacterium]|nr:SMC-Scp complex subunit ScpB [Ignavibacteriales bacterium]